MECRNTGILEEDHCGRAVGSTAGRRSAVPPTAAIGPSPSFYYSIIPPFQFEVIDKAFTNRTNNVLTYEEQCDHLSLTGS